MSAHTKRKQFGLSREKKSKSPGRQKILQWIYRFVVKADLVMQMRASRAAGRADAPNKFTSGYGLPLKHVDVREMAVASGKTSAMVYDNKLAITVLPTHKRYRSARSSNDRVA